MGYPEALQPPKKEEKEKVSTAILSITAKSKARQKKANPDEAMDVDDKSEGNKGSKSEKSEKEIESEKKKEEADFEMVDNPARVIPPQLKRLTLPSTCRYQPLKSVNVGGIILMKDSMENEPEDLIEPLPASATPGTETEEDEPKPPEPFEYIED